MLNSTHTTASRRSAARRNKPYSIQTRRNASGTRKHVAEKFANALLSGDKRELDQILREIARVSPPSQSPEKFFALISGLLASTAHRAVKMHGLQEVLRSQALTDDLTGLNNRRGFFALAGQQLKFARRNREHALLFFADIDGLKGVNDRFGHSEGDAAIRRTARALKRTFRDSDVIARLSGDEFAILANEAGPDSEREILRRLKENLDLESACERRYPLSVSVGVARFDPKSPRTLEELLHLADRAMYQAKRSRVAA
jgi:diguanylate cyclase (GGDEF)-like protein